MSSSWVDVLALDDLEEEIPEGVQAGGYYIALYRIGERVYATGGCCSHAEAKLCDGYVDGDVIECPLHQARFHIPTGRVLSAPADQDIPVFPVKIRGDRILVQLPGEDQSAWSEGGSEEGVAGKAHQFEQEGVRKCRE